MSRDVTVLTAELALESAAREAGVRAHVSRCWMSWLDVTIRHAPGADPREAHRVARALPFVDVRETLRNHATGEMVSLGSLCLRRIP